MNSVVQRVPVGQDNVRIGLITYSEEPKYETEFTEDVSDFNLALSNVAR